MNAPYYKRHGVTVHAGDCLDVLATMADASIDAVVCDPPYGLEFMGKEWDRFGRDTGNGYQEKPRMNNAEGFGGYKERPNYCTAGHPFQTWCQQWATECLRVLKPGGHLLAFGGTRTYHRLTCGVEDAGFEIRDSIMWIMGSGFPKGKNVSADPLFCQCSREPAVPYSHGDDDVRGVRPEVRDVAPDVASGQVANVLAPVQRQGTRSRMGDAWSEGLRGADPGESGEVGAARRAEPGMEGRGDVQAGKGQLCRPAVCPMSAGPADDGEVGRVRDGAPASDGPLDRSGADAHGVREPRQSQPAGQSPGEPRPLADERSAQARRGRALCAGCGKPGVAPGLNTALKPAHEPIIVARKPCGGTVAATVLAYGTGALNVDGCRVPHADPADRAMSQSKNPGRTDTVTSEVYGAGRGQQSVNVTGRWPANVVLDGDAAAELDARTADLKGGITVRRGLGEGREQATHGIYGSRIRAASDDVSYGDSGGASRFFPVFRWEAKAPSAERPQVGGVSHPTVKPLDLMRWLVRLVTPPGGTVLDPFAGSGTTLHAARAEGFEAIGIERDPTYLPLIVARLDARPRQATTSPPVPDGEPLDLLDLLDGVAS